MDHSGSWFDNIYRKYSAKIFDIANQALGNPFLAEEIVQETFAVLFMRRDEVKKYDSVEAFLINVARKKIGNEYQKAYRKREEPLEDKHALLAAPEAGQECVEEFLPDWLSEKDRKMLLWRAEEELDYREIARRLGCSEHACHGRMYRLREKFKKFRSRE